MNESASFVSSLEAAARQELKQITPQLMNAVRTMSSKLRSWNVDGMVRELMGTEAMEELWGRNTSHVSGNQFEQYLRRVVVPNAMRASQFAEFREMRYGTPQIKDRTTLSPREMLPASYQASYDQGKYVAANLGRDKIMGNVGRAHLADLIGRSDAAARAAYSIPGMIEYDKDNNPQLSRTITSSMINAFRKNMLNDLQTRTEGQKWRQNERNQRDFYHPTEKSVEQMSAAMMTGSGSRVLQAMKSAEELLDSSRWIASERADKLNAQPITFSAKRDLEYYGIGRYNFADLVNGNTRNMRVVPITESDATRTIGGFKHNQFSNKVIEIAINGENGYDRNNAAHRAYAEKIWAPGSSFDVGGQSYVVQTLHGTGENAIIRAVRQEDMATVEAAQKQRLIDAGLPRNIVEQFGGYFNNFIPANHQFDSIKGIRGHLEGLNKMWTGSSAQRKPMNGARFAIVDTSINGVDVADGTGWFVQSVLDNSGSQMRPAIGAKGTNVVVGNKNTHSIGEWLVGDGLSPIMKDPWGNDVDTNTVQGIVSWSQIKNKPMYNALVQQGYSPHEAFSKLMNMYGASEMLTLENADHSVNALKQQQTTFMHLSPEMIAKQADIYATKIRQLQTPAGMRELAESMGYGKDLDEGRMSIEDPAIVSSQKASIEALRGAFMRGELLDE